MHAGTGFCRPGSTAWTAPEMSTQRIHPSSPAVRSGVMSHTHTPRANPPLSRVDRRGCEAGDARRAVRREACEWVGQRALDILWFIKAWRYVVRSAGVVECGALNRNFGEGAPAAGSGWKGSRSGFREDGSQDPKTHCSPGALH